MSVHPVFPDPAARGAKTISTCQIKRFLTNRISPESKRIKAMLLAPFEGGACKTRFQCF